MKNLSKLLGIVFLAAITFAFFSCEQPADLGPQTDDPSLSPQTVAKPTATPAGGNYTSAQTVTLVSTTEGAAIRYTLNGTTPTASSTLYSSPITISETRTLKAIAIKAGMTNSDILTATYTITPPGKVVQPVATPAEGTYPTTQTVSLTSVTTGADIHYTLDGTTPTTGSTKYSSPITISETKTLKAIAVKASMTNSDILTAIYTIGCIVTFDANGGTPAPVSPITVSLLSTIVQPPPAMTKTWHIFDNWYTDSECTVPAVFPITVYGNINLYARWIVTSVDGVRNYLTSLPSNSTNNPASLALSLDLGTMTATNSGWQQLLDAISTTGKYVNLDLSLCTMNGTSFNPDSSVATGKDRIVSIILPTVATSTEAGSPTNPTFRSFTNLKSINGAYITTIGNSAFYNSSFSGNTTLQIAEFPRVTNIGSYAFYNCKGLQSANFPQVITIGINAFENCTSIQGVNFPLATSIRGRAFYNCTALQSASFPASAELDQLFSTYSNPFSGCTSLTSFTLIGTGSLSVIENGRVLVRNGTILLAYPTATGTITLNTITSIDGSAFESCTSLQSVSFPQATSIGGMAFYRCTGLQSASFPQVTSIGSSAFSTCTSLQNVNFPLVTSIGSNAFTDTNLQSASFPQATSIGSMAFYLCTSLQSLNIPKVTSIGMFAFGQAGNTALSITMGSTAPTLAREIFADVTSAKTVTVKVPTGATGYTPFTGSTVTVSGTNTTTNWANGFRGGSWNGTTWADTSNGGTATINQNISLIIERQ